MRPQILVVEDSNEIGLLEQRILEREGYEVTRVASGGEALAFVRDRVPDLILSDIMMPEIDGYRLLELLRADPRLTAVPVIFVSALGDAQSVERGRRLGVDQYLVKPFTSEQIRSTVSGTLRRYGELKRAQLIGHTASAPAPQDFAPTGIAPIDDRAGGLGRGRCYLTVGGVGGGAGVLAVQFLHRALEKGEGALLVTTERLDSVLYAGASIGLDLEPHLRSGRLIVSGLVERFEYMLETRDDVTALTSEIAAYAAECGATRMVVSSILTLLCSAPRLVLSAPLVGHLVSSLEATGATTLLVSDEPVTAHEELAEAYLKRTTFGTMLLAKEGETRGTGTIRFERLQGIPAEPSPCTFRVAFGTGLVTVDPAAAPHVYDELDALKRRVEVELAAAGQDETGLAPLGEGNYRLRDPFVLYLRDCLGAALKVTRECAVVVCRFDLEREDGSTGPETVVHPRDLGTVLAGQEILAWAQPTELVAVALGADTAHGERLRDRLARWLGAFATEHGLVLRELQAVVGAYPADGATVDTVLETVDRRLARTDARAATHAVA